MIEQPPTTLDDIANEVIATVQLWLSDYIYADDTPIGRIEVRNVNKAARTFELTYGPADERYSPYRAVRVTLSIEEVQP